MPRIPDKEILGDRPALPVDRSIQSPQYATAPLQAGIEGLSRIGAAAGRVGQAIEGRAVAMQQAGEKLNDWGVVREKQNSKYILAQEKLKLIQESTDLQNSLADDPDYNTAQDRYNKTLSKRIQPPPGLTQEDANEWNITAQEVLMRGSQNVYEMAHGKMASASVANLEDSMSKGMATFAKTKDPVIRAQLLTGVGNSIDANPYIPEHQKGRMKRQWTNDAAIYDLREKPAIERLKEINNYLSSGDSVASDAETIINERIDYENSPNIIKDGNGESRFGIHVNKVTGLHKDVDLASLTREGAAKIGKEEYWNAMDLDNAPANMRRIIYGAAYNQGVPMAKKMLEETGYDLAKFADVRRREYKKLADARPDLSKNLNGWLNSVDMDIKNSVKPSGTMVDFISPENLIKERDDARRDLQVTMKATITDAIAEVGDTGSTSLMPPAEDVVTVFGAEKAAEIIDGYNTAKRYGQAKADMALKTDEEIVSTLEAMKPSGEGYADESVRYNDSVSAASDLVKERNSDPQGYAVKHKIAAETTIDFNKPEQAAPSVAELEKIAVYMRDKYKTPFKLFTKQQEKQLGEVMNKATPDLKMKIFSTIYSSVQNKDSYMSAMAQIGQADPASAMAGAYLGLGDKSSTSSSGTIKAYDLSRAIVEGQDILNPIKADGKEGKSLMPMPPPEELGSFYSGVVGDAYSGMPESNNGSFAAFKAYYAYLSAKEGDYKGELNRERAAKAINDIVGNVVKNGRHTTIIPWGMDEDSFNTASKLAIKEIAQKNGFNTMRLMYGAFHLQNTTDYGRFILMNGDEPFKEKDGSLAIINMVQK